MKLTVQDVEKIANLARLKFDKAELEKFSTQLSGILTHIDQLNELNTDGIEPTAHIESMSTPLREDTAIVNDAHKAILDQAPLRDEELFEVPKVL